jgi:hypothetical protein
MYSSQIVHPNRKLNPIVYKCMLSVFRPSVEVVKEGLILFYVEVGGS